MATICPKCNKPMRMVKGTYSCRNCNISFPEDINPEFYSGIKFLLFTSPECPYCPEAKKQLEKITLGFDEVDISKNEELASKYDVKSIPLLLIKNDKEFIKLLFAC